MAVLTRDAILSANDLPREKISVPEWGGDVYVRSMTGSERDAFEASMFRDGKDRLVNVRARVVALCTVDENGERLFTDADVEALGKKSAAALDRVFAAANKVSALGKDAVDEAKKA